MKIILATSNKGKVKEIKELWSEYEVVPYSELIEEFEIVEDAHTFKDNALLKARAVYKALGDKEAIVIADDSGISVDILKGEPGIYSARYAGAGASDKDNLYKLIKSVKDMGVISTPAHYTAAIAIIYKEKEYSVHGWMYGDVINETRGEKGFGYDPMFIPSGYNKTVAELDANIKSKLSHRSKALSLAKVIIESVQL
ncbi:MAG: RdgB/HAM1 family non-canonical purine NTP pyrophosphatase [Helicobacteraceae bacterium]|nr:RdgB/HAM1 family non-canonical purine NTP pyrophosphatase [Helicobacteraceae bacterium]